MILQHVVDFVNNPGKMLLVVVFSLFSIGALLAWKKYNRPFLLYAHLFFVFTPLFYFALSINCSLAGIQGLLSWCTALFAKFIIFIVPPLMAFSFVLGVAILPKLYNKIAKPFSLKAFNRLCGLTSINADLFLIDKASPTAFTLGNRVFVSVGLLEMLSKKELEAVLLHELHHVKCRSSWSKFSSFFVRFFSPVAWFSVDSVEREECAADNFAISVQKSDRFLLSAKRKVVTFK